MNSKSFVVICLYIICTTNIFAQDANRHIKKVHLIFKTHLDIGFTKLSSEVERQYIEDFIPNTLNIIEQLKAEKAEERYVWTTGSWLIASYLQQATPEAVKKLETAILQGDIVWNAVPYTVESEMMSHDLFSACLKQSQQLDRRFGKKTIAAKMTDVPGHTRSIVTPMSDAGISLLHIGVNPACPVPDVPTICRWKNTDGKEIVLMYHGDYGDDTILPDGETVVSVNFTGDNHGPHPLSKIKEIYSAARLKYPNAEILATSLNDVASDINTMLEKIPVVTSEIGDTWIYGFGTSPLRVARYRELSRLFSKWIQSGKIDMNNPATVDFAVMLGLVAEHTQGFDIKTHLKNWDKYDIDIFNAARSSEPFRLTELSWAEIDAYVDRAITLLPDVLQKEARNALKIIEEPAVMKISGKDRHPQFNEKGVYKMSAKGIDVMVGELSYLSFSPDDYDRFLDKYLRRRYGWALSDLGKPGLENTKAKSATVVASVENCKVLKNNQNTTVQYNLKFQSTDDIDSRVMPESITMEYTIPASGNKIDMKVTFINKPAVRLPEAYLLSIVPSDIINIFVEKMGFMVDVSDVVEGGNRQMHAIDNHIDIVTGRGTVRITSLDAPLVVIGERKMLNYSTQLPDLSKGVHFNLVNNLWGTNFSMWWEGSVTYRFTVEVKS